LLICIHGGGWAMGDKAGGSPLIAFTKDGYAVAVISYRLSDQAKFPAQIQDCKAAVRWLRANAAKYKIDPDCFGTWGGSAGGHLSALTGTSGGSKEFEPIGGNAEVSDRVQAVCDLFGPTDLLKMNEQSNGRGPIKHDGARSPESMLIGGPIQDNKEKTERANPIKYITKECPPFLIMHGLNDDMVPIGQSEMLLEALKKQGTEATLLKIRAGHGGPEFSQPANLKIIREFFDKHLKKTGATKDAGTRENESKTPAPAAEKKDDTSTATAKTLEPVAPKKDEPTPGELRIGERKADAPQRPEMPGRDGPPNRQTRPGENPGGNSAGNRPSPWGSPVRIGGDAANMKAIEYKQVDPQPLHMWVFYPEGWKATDARAGIVFFCGGAWSHADHNEFVPWARYLASRGMVAGVAEYRPKGALTCGEDATSAVRWFRAHCTELGVDPNMIGASGGSAGGQMAAFTALCEPRNAANENTTISAKPNVLVLFDAVLDMKAERAAERLSAPDKMALSPIDHMANDSVPTLLFYGSECPFVGQARAFLAKSKTLGNSVQLYTAPGSNHTYYFRPPWRQLTFTLMDEFLVARGFLKAGAPTPKVETDVKHTNENN